MNNNPKLRFGAGYACALAALSGLLGTAIPAAGQPAGTQGSISWFMPLQVVAERLQQRYGKPVTYEDPARMWRGEVESRGTLGGRDVLVVKRHTLVLPRGIEDSRTLGPELVTAILTAYHQQNPDQARFRVVESKMGLHIVPAQAHDATGVLIPVSSPFDVRVNVQTASRTAAEHLTALCDAVTAAAGMKIESHNPYADGYFAANGYKVPRLRTGAERPYMLFEWGASGEIARDALVDLLDHSSTTLSWALRCGPTSGQRDNGCYFELAPLQVGPERKVVLFDRCPSCRALPGR